MKLHSYSFIICMIIQFIIHISENKKCRKFKYFQFSYVLIGVLNEIK